MPVVEKGQSILYSSDQSTRYRRKHPTEYEAQPNLENSSSASDPYEPGCMIVRGREAASVRRGTKPGPAGPSLQVPVPAGGVERSSAYVLSLVWFLSYPCLSICFDSCSVGRCCQMQQADGRADSRAGPAAKTGRHEVL